VSQRAVGESTYESRIRCQNRIELSEGRSIFFVLQVQFTPLEIDEESLAYGAHQEVGAGGHFLGAVHTLERFRECFYRPLLSSTENFQRWERLGGRDATERAGEIYAKTLEEYEEPAMDAAIRSELEEYVTRRRAELGD
jgi:trimethylamine--corrinoid protein Co-methyltransferase